MILFLLAVSLHTTPELDIISAGQTSAPVYLTTFDLAERK